MPIDERSGSLLSNGQKVVNICRARSLDLGITKECESLTENGLPRCRIRKRADVQVESLGECQAEGGEGSGVSDNVTFSGRTLQERYVSAAAFKGASTEDKPRV